MRDMTSSSKMVECPFYHDHDGKHRLSCEGMVDRSILTQQFATKSDLQKQMDIFCYEYYKKCEIYRMLMETKYAD